MKRNQLILLVVVGAVIAGAGLFLYKRENQSWSGSDQGMGQKLIKDFPLNDVTHVVVREGTNEVNLVKVDEQWTLRERGAYPANFAEISQFLRKVWDLKVAQPQNVSAAQLSRFELLPPGKATNAAVLVEFRGKDEKQLKTLLLGKKHMRQSQGDSPFGGGGGWPDGRYVMVGDDVKSVALVTETFTEISPKADSWLDKEFFKVEKIKSVSVTSTNATNNWSVSRETEQGDWKFSDPKPAEEIDKAKASGLGNVLTSAAFNDVVAGDKKPEETGLDQPRVATIETFDQLAYKIKIGNTNEEGNYYFQMSLAGNLPKERTPGKDEKPEDKDKLDKEFKEKTTKLEEKLKNEKKYEKWTYITSKWSIDPLLKDRKDLVAEKKEETSASPATGVPPTTLNPPSAPSVNAVPFSPLKPEDAPVIPKPPQKPPPIVLPKSDLKPPPLPEKNTPEKPPGKPEPAKPAAPNGFSAHSPLLTGD